MAKILQEPDSAADDAAHAVIGAALQVHKELGPGFLESVYEEALGLELLNRQIAYLKQPQISICYREREVGLARPDMLVASCLIVELKAVEALSPIHTAQVISYLRASNLRLGLLLNFNVPVMQRGIKRVIRS